MENLFKYHIVFDATIVFKYKIVSIFHIKIKYVTSYYVLIQGIMGTYS